MAERSSYTCTLDADNIAQMKRDLEARGFMFREIPYAHFGAEHRGEKVNVAVFFGWLVADLWLCNAYLNRREEVNTSAGIRANN